MKWVRFRIETTVDAEDLVVSALYDIGLEGAQVEDKVPLTALEKEQMFVDILPESQEDDGIAFLSFFVEEQEGGGLELLGEQVDREEVLRQIGDVLGELRQFCDIGVGTVTVDETEDLDWINNWKQYFHQFYIDDILVIPSWEAIAAQDKDKIVLHIDPGTAFGTGMHETTQLVIRQLRKYVMPDTELLDVGTGSGILSILALMFGAKHATGTDLDECALEAVVQNCHANAISVGIADAIGIDVADEMDTTDGKSTDIVDGNKSPRFDMLLGNIITDKALQDRVGYESCDIVAANILADVLVPLTPVAARHLKPGGVYITSGILDGKEGIVAEAVEAAGLRILEMTRQGEWVCITAQKP